jgi:perosamine synthetase
MSSNTTGPGTLAGAAIGARIPLSVPFIAGHEWDYVRECLDTGWVSSVGSYVERFERDCAQAVGVAHGVACSSGTAALTLALRVAGVRVGDAVVLPTATFIAPVNAAAYLGAQPVFMDCDEYYNLDAAKTIEFLQRETERREGGTYHVRTGRRIGAVVPVHVFGNAAWLDDLVPFCRDAGIPVVEDAAEALGTRYTRGRFAGRHAGAVGDLGCLSFNGNKIITTGGGGMVLTDRAEHARAARYLSTQAKDDAVYFVHDEVGYNFRLTNVQAAIGVAQLERLADYQAAKQRVHRAYADAFAGIDGLSLAPPPPWADNNCWMVALRIDPARYGEDRDAVLRRLEREGIETRPLWHLNHLQRPYRDCPTYRIERAPALLRETLNIPCSVALAETEQARVIEALRR